MRAAKRHRTIWPIAASALAHVAMLAVILVQSHALLMPADRSEADDTVIRVQLVPRPQSAAVRSPPAPGAIRARRPALQPSEAAPPIAPLSATPAPEGPNPAGAAAGADLRAALRHGLAGCANAGAGLTRAERERCDERLGRNMAQAPFLGAPLEPKVRAYYDAVALAKQRDPPHVAVINKEPIRGDPPPRRPGGDHLPAFFCSLHFGPGQQPRKLPHALYLGHCVIEPPKGPLDPEVDITPP
jgi:hypothetical protein